jgi:signal transduction histidine kinase
MGSLTPDIRVTLQVRDLDVPVGPASALAAYRVAQEAVNNAIKHSGGHSIQVELGRDRKRAQ